jgi:hypothetical protein
MTQFTRVVDGTTELRAALFNDLQEAIEELYAKVGTTFVAGRIYGSETAAPGGSSTNVAVTADLLYAAPFWTGPDGITITSLSFNITIASAGNARLGIYQSDTEPPYYPTELLLDAGTLAHTGTGVKSVDIADTVYTGSSPSRLLWLASVFSTTPTVSMIAQLSPPVEINSSGNTRGGMTMNHTFSSLPTTYADPPDATVQSVPQIWIVAG